MGAMPVPDQQATTPNVASNVAPIAAAAQQLGPQQGVSEAQMGAPPKAQPTPAGGIKGALTKVAQMAAIGIGPTVASIAKQHTQQEQTRNQHVIDTVWNAHVAETGARNKVDQYQKIIQQVDQHMKDVQALPDSDPSKIGQMGYLAHIHQQVVGEFKQQAQIIKQSQQTTQALLADPKNRKILAKAVGYDEKAANTPERQQMIAAIQKTQKGASQAEAQLESQFAQGPSQSSPGLPVPVQSAVLREAGTQATVDQKGQAAAAKAQQIKTTPFKGKTGVMFDQSVPYGWTAPDGKQYTASSPDMPEEGKRAMKDANAAYDRYTKMKNQTGTAAKERADAYWGNYLLHSQGIDMKGQALPGAIKTGEGTPVGSALQSNVRPTGMERQRADLATSAKDQMNEMESILTRRKDLFGPASGRKTNFTQWIGSQDPDAQRFTAAARVAADHLAGVFGGRSEAALEGIYNVIGKNTTNPKAAIAALNQMMKAANIIQERGTVHTIGGNNMENGKPGASSQNDPLGILK